MKRVCVFCGSRPGALPAYVGSARRLGTALARRRITLVYGGMKGGLMGEIADSVIAAGGGVIGVIPRLLAEKGLGHPGITDLRVVDSMHTRKALMIDLSDAFIVLPGGVGTLEEFFEVWAWSTLDVHRKPFGLLNVGEYYAGLLAFVDHAVSEGFVKEAYRTRLRIEEDPEALIDRLEARRGAR
jgi:uncharacterized protein (TIGR00730 family)